jgi:uncharacterized membrane protein YadS
MARLVLPLLAALMGVWGLVSWWGNFVVVTRGLVPGALILLGTMAVASGLRRMAEADQGPQHHSLTAKSWFMKEDWWAIAIGLSLVLVGLASFTSGSGALAKLAINPGTLHWNSPSELATHFVSQGRLYLVQFGLWALVFGCSCQIMGIGLGDFLKGFTVLYLLSVTAFAVGGWAHAASFNLEPPLVALLLGLAIANTIPLPGWLDAALRVEYYVKCGIVLLGATFPLTLLVTAGPVAIGQATVISLITCGTIYFLATRYFALDRRLAAVISIGGAVCGVSASMAIAAAVGARKQHIYYTVTLVVCWALVMIIALPFLCLALGLDAGVAGAWIGTSEFADAAGIAAATSYGHMVGNEEAVLKSFTLMKVIGRDLWIGIWAALWAFIATFVWRQGDDGEGEGREGRNGGVKEIWRRFPKFVFGFFIASALVTLATGGTSPWAYDPRLRPELLAPLGALRGWVFIFCFLSIGLTTRFRTLTAVPRGAVIAFSLGVAVNVIVGYLLSVHLFGTYWSNL